MLRLRRVGGSFVYCVCIRIARPNHLKILANSLAMTQGDRLGLEHGLAERFVLTHSFAVIADWCFACRFYRRADCHWPQPLTNLAGPS